MGYISTEQTTEILDSVTRLADVATRETPTVVQSSEPNYWWLLILGIVPVWFGYWLNNRRKK